MLQRTTTKIIPPTTELEKKLESSSFRVPAPRTPGDYVLRFFPSLCGYTFVAKSNTIRVPNKDKLTTELIKDETNGRIKSIKVQWIISSVDPSPYDYLALYKSEALNNSYICYKYIDPKNNHVVMDAPCEVETYNVRYHSSTQSKYTDIARSDSIQIENTDTVTATVTKSVVTVTWDIHSQPHTTWDWVGIYKKGITSNTNYVDYKYIDLNTKVLVFSVREAGEYEARFFSSRLGRYTDFRKSNAFVVNH